MNGLAMMLIDRGYRVTGSDQNEGYLLGGVRAKGAEVTIGHSAQNVQGADAVFYSAAIGDDNPERMEAERLGIPCMERAYLVGMLMEGYARRAGICGTHGKTTTTSMLSQILVEDGKDPGIHIGGILPAIGGSVRDGQGDIFVTEACEFHRSFLHMPPTVAVVLNIEEDHLDYYRDIDEIESAFGEYLALLPPDGTAVGNGDDIRVRRQMDKLTCKRVYVGLDRNNDWYPDDVYEDPLGLCSFDVKRKGEKAAHVSMAIPGRFNMFNALAAMAAADALGVPPEKAAQTLSRFQGARRRFELTDTINGVELFHDYGHNPTEMRNAISIARKRCKGRLWAVMQPVLFTRVRALFDSYLTCTAEADMTLITDIYGGREKDPGDLNSGMLADGMRKNGIPALWTPSFDDTEKYLLAHWQPGDLVITLSGATVNLLNDQISRHARSNGI